jgi:hypothetical protein
MHKDLFYQFEKIGEAIMCPNEGNTNIGLSMLSSVEKAYLDFENELIERSELPGNQDLQYDLEQYKYAVLKIREYLNNGNAYLTDCDARIYLYYIREEHRHFVDIADEYDKEYNR